ncbi:MAG: YlbF family regulator [Gemmatimonadales bacterium]
MMWEKAQELGRLIGQTPECKALRRAEGNLRENEESQKLLENIQTHARSLEQAMGAGQEPDEATAQSYEKAVRDLELSTAGQAYVAARANFEKVMLKVNQQISDGIEKGATSSIITLG